MKNSTRKVALGAAAAVIVIAIAGLLVVLNQEPAYDRTFISRVPDPAYPQGGPVVLYDEGHLNTHTAASGYRPLADLVRNDGYTLRLARQALTPRDLEEVAVLVIVLAQGRNDTNDDPAYSEAEAAAVEDWVRGGGSLLLITDHWPYGAAVASLAERLDIELGTGIVQDTAHHERAYGDSHLVFSEENRLLGDHPIVRGRSDAERIRRVITFTGTSMRGSAAAVPFLVLSDVATERPPGSPQVEREGGDVRVHMEYGDPVGATGRAQGLALEIGAGRAVVLGDAGMLRAQTTRSGMRVGMHVPGYDNRQLALNIMHWLSRAL